MSRAEGARAVPMVARLRGISHCWYEKVKNSNSPHYDKTRGLFKRKETDAIKSRREKEKRGKIKRNEGG